MNRCSAAMRLPALLLAALQLVALAHAGPLGPVSNETLSERKGSSCAVGDVVYMPGDEFPGSDLCERCTCVDGNVSCVRTRCEPRPGCKAVHRPDHCCPTYQCECEQEGRVYGNGEKLVDPADPCRVCYCQGGEVVCRRIACFVRDDCTPRLVPGRCCPEYDNCPLRGVTTFPGVAPSVSTMENVKSSPAPSPPKENIKQEITIKEITPVSEIPILPEVKVKEILPLPSIEGTEYSSSKSPLIVREATTEKAVIESEVTPKTKAPVMTELQSSSSTMITSSEPIGIPAELAKTSPEGKITDDNPPSKISLSTQDSINSDIYPSILTSVPTMGVPSNTPQLVTMVSTTRAPVVEEEDPTLFDHNPAFPPLPDDLSVLRNHEGDILPEQIPEEHVSEALDPVSVPSPSLSPVIVKESSTDSPITTPKEIFKSATMSPTTTKVVEEVLTVSSIATEPKTAIEFNNANKVDVSTSNPLSTTEPIIITKLDTTTSTQTTSIKDSPMLNLRSAIPAEILNVPSQVPEEITGEDDSDDLTTAAELFPATVTSSNPYAIISLDNKMGSIFRLSVVTDTVPITSTTLSETKAEATDITTQQLTESSTQKMIKTSSETTPQKEIESLSITPQQAIETSSVAIQTTQESTTSSVAKSSRATEITAQTEPSSLPVETSDQNPQESLENSSKDTGVTSTVESSSKDIVITSTEPLSTVEITNMKVSSPIESEVITVSRSIPSSTENQSFENVETTEFVLTSFGSSESATDAVELIKISAEPDKSAAIIETTPKKKNNVLTDLINLVGDVAAISDHTDSPDATRHVTLSASSISDSEELIPVNAGGYKSKNNNWNLNSITETIPVKSKSQISANKQKVVEIEGEDTDNITDSPPPNDKVEPTTKRPIIDNVYDDHRQNKTDSKEIEIITKSYVPTINKRPTKVVMKKSNEMPVGEDMVMEDAVSSSSEEASTESPIVSSEAATIPPSSAPATDRIDDSASTTTPAPVAQ